MRVLKKQAISRRSFLKGSTVTALGLTVIGPTIFGKNNAWSATFKNISADDGATLVQMARDIYPHDHLADKYYAAVISGYDKAAGKDKASSEPGRSIVGKVNAKQVREIAENKMKDLNAADIEGAIKMVEGSARSMGIEITE